MKRMLFTVMLVIAAVAGTCTAFAQGEEPLVYVVKKGDTLWGLSDRFLKDPHYWPNLWARNPPITNPHLIFPGQKVKIYPDRIVLEEAVPPTPPLTQLPAGMPAQERASTPPQAATPAEDVVLSRSFTVRSGAAFLLESGVQPAGHIVSTYQDRQMVGESDVVYTDIGLVKGGKVDDRFSIFKNLGPIRHPVSKVVVGDKIIPLGALKLSDVKEQASKALITKSYLEVGAGAYLLPYREPTKEVSLKATDRELTGYIVDSQADIQGISLGDIVFLDLGAAQGLEVGNMLYVVRDIVPERRYGDAPIDKFPAEVLGAVVVVEIGKQTSTALVVKSNDPLYAGDRVELIKSK